MRGEKGRKVLIGRVWTKTIRGSVYTLGKGFVEIIVQRSIMIRLNLERIVPAWHINE